MKAEQQISGSCLAHHRVYPCPVCTSGTILDTLPLTAPPEVPDTLEWQPHPPLINPPAFGFLIRVSECEHCWCRELPAQLLHDIDHVQCCNCGLKKVVVE